MADDVKTLLLDAAQRLIQTRGFHGFSYRDLVAEVGITTASIHYHFPAKADLGVALVRRYREAVVANLAEAAGQPTLATALERATGVYLDTLHAGERVCVCGALAGEFAGLPEPVRDELRALIAASERGFAEVLRAGQARGELAAGRDVSTLARLWYGALQGGLLLARAAADETALAQIVAGLRETTLHSP